MLTGMGTDTGGYNAPHFVPFDTLAISEELKASGVPSKQAKAHAQMMYNLISNNMATKMDVARIEERIELLRSQTQSDIKRVNEKIANVEKKIANVEERIELLRNETKSDIARVEERIARIEEKVARVEERIARIEEKVARVEEKITTVTADMLKWIVPMMMAQLFAMAGLIKFLIN